MGAGDREKGREGGNRVGEWKREGGRERRRVGERIEKRGIKMIKGDGKRGCKGENEKERK